MFLCLQYIKKSILLPDIQQNQTLNISLYLCSRKINNLEALCQIFLNSVSKNVLLLQIEKEDESFSPLTFILVKSFFSLHFFCFVFILYFSLEKLEFKYISFSLCQRLQQNLSKKKKKKVKLKFTKEFASGTQNEIGYGEEKKFCFKIVPAIDTPW